MIIRKIAEIGRFQLFLSYPFFFGWNYYPKQYIEYLDKDGRKGTLQGGIFKVYYWGYLEVRIYNKQLYKIKLNGK